VPVVKTITEYVEVPVERIVEKVIIREKPAVTLKDFESLDELDAFLAGFDVKKTIIPGGLLLGQCEDFALYMIQQAELKGYKLHLNVLYGDGLKEWYGYDNAALRHAVCLAIIGNCVYLIEPERAKYWLAFYLD
jgi:hypothetical protein